MPTVGEGDKKREVETPEWLACRCVRYSLRFCDAELPGLHLACIASSPDVVSPVLCAGVVFVRAIEGLPCTALQLNCSCLIAALDFCVCSDNATSAVARMYLTSSSTISLVRICDCLLLQLRSRSAQSSRCPCSPSRFLADQAGAAAAARPAVEERLQREQIRLPLSHSPLRAAPAAGVCLRVLCVRRSAHH